MMSPVLAILVLVGLLRSLFVAVSVVCLPDFKPTLTAAARDGEVTLSWKVVQGRQPSIDHWRYRQTVQGADATEADQKELAVDAIDSYVVRELVNGVTYVSQVQAVLKSGEIGCWSDPIPAVPGYLRQAMRRLEEHQQAIVGNTSLIVLGITDNGKSLRKLGQRLVGTLEGIASSARRIADESEDVGDRVEELGDSVDSAGENIVGALDGIAKQLGGEPDRQESDDGSELGDGSAGEDGPEEGDCPRDVDEPEKADDGGGAPRESDSSHSSPPRTRACRGTMLGQLYFSEGSHHIGVHNEETIREIVRRLEDLHGGVVLTEGFATEVGSAVYNLRLSDMRAACASACLRERIQTAAQFEFREIAHGEELDTGNIPSASHRSRRVSVTLCETRSKSTDSRTYGETLRSVEECDCP